jgi:hypothetical protein
MKRNDVRTHKDMRFHIFRAVSIQIVVFEVVTVCSLGGKCNISEAYAASICRVESVEVSTFVRNVDSDLWPIFLL